MHVRDRLVLVAALLFLAASPALGQQRGAEQPPAGEAELKLEREFFIYPRDGRRDPFVSLAARTDMGPRFEELRLSGIIYSPGGGSVLLLTDASGKAHRVRQGGVIGNARVVDIGPNHGVFAVENFGVVRQERLEMKPREGGSMMDPNATTHPDQTTDLDQSTDLDEVQP